MQSDIAWVEDDTESTEAALKNQLMVRQPTIIVATTGPSPYYESPFTPPPRAAVWWRSKASATRNRARSAGGVERH